MANNFRLDMNGSEDFEERDLINNSRHYCEDEYDLDKVGGGNSFLCGAAFIYSKRRL